MNAWLTPDASDLAGTPEDRTVSVPPELWPFVSGCLLLLAEVENWEEFGTATPEEMAEYFTNFHDAFIASNP
ncbi:MAG: hypothetical protein H6658_20680 [Ardenticatenaceae bacterium]|nr:hypothetical protein [Ardenticatenaceae bacterium]